MARPKTTKTLPRLNFTIRANKCLYYVIAYNGQTTTAKSTGIKIESSERWNKNRREVVGNETKTLLLTQLEKELNDVYGLAVINGQSVTVQMLFDCLTKRRDFIKQIPDLLGAIDEYILIKKVLRDSGKYDPKSYRDLFARKTHVSDFLAHKYKTQNVTLKELTPSVGNDFELFLRTKKNHQSETVRKVTNFLSSVLRFAQSNEWVNRNVMDFYKKPKRQTTEPNTLNSLEIKELKNLFLPNSVTDAVRWQFIFMVYTALNHVDLVKLLMSDFVPDPNGGTSIKRGRSKTAKTTYIPLVEPTKAIIERFSDHQQKTGFVFPMLSIDKFNKHLKIIQGIWQFERFTLTTKIGRSTCSTLLGSMGVPHENIMQITGHTKVETLRNSYLESSRMGTKNVYFEAFSKLDLL